MFLQYYTDISLPFVQFWSADNCYFTVLLYLFFQEDNVRTSMMADQVQYYFQLAQQATGNLQQQAAQTTAQTGTVQASPVQATQATTQAIANQLQVPGEAFCIL